MLRAAVLLLATLPALARAQDPALQSAIQSLNTGRYAEARQAFESLSQTAPDSPQVWLALTQLYARANESALRASAAQRALALAHAKPDWATQSAIRNYLGKVYLADLQYPQAVSEYQEAIRLAPDEETYRFDLAQAQLGRQDFAAAAQTLEAARPVFGQSAQITLALGVAYYGQRRFREAIGAFLRTIALAPEVAQPYVFLGKMLDQAGDRLPEIQQRFAEFLQANPDNYTAYLLVAKGIGAAQGDSAKEEEMLRQSIARKPDAWEAHYELGCLLESRHAFEDAARELELSAQLHPDVAAIHYHLARVYDRLKQPQRAATERDLHAQLLAHEKITAGMEPAAQ